MNRRIEYFVWGLALTLALPATSLAKNVFILPGGAPAQEVRVFSEALGSLGSFTGSVGPSLKVLSNPTGTKLYAFAQSGSDTLIVVDQNLARLLNFSPGANGQAGAITPDGRRLLLLTTAGLHIFDADTLTRLRGPIEVGDTPIDIAVSVDSRYAFVLSSNSRRLTRIDLSSNAVAGELTIPGLSTSVTAAPNGLLYVGATNRLFEIDGHAMTRRSEIAVNGMPARPSFTADGRYAVAVNTAIFTNSPAFWLFDLETRSATAVRAIDTTFPDVNYRDIRVVSNSRAILLSNDNRLFQLTLPALALSQLTVYGVGQPIEVRAFAASDEVPAARSLYYLNPLGLHRLDLFTNRLNPEAPVAITGSPIGLSFSGAAATGSPMQLILYNQSQSINAGETFRPLVVRAADANGRPLYNVPVMFATAVAGVALSETSVNTNADGLAMTRVDPGTVTGRFTVTVQAGALSATFSLAVGTGGPGAQGLQIKSGNGQVVVEGESSKPMVIVVRDSEGKPVPNVPITWEIVEGQGAGTLLPLGSVTDANGEASAQFIGGLVQFGFSYQQARIRASTATESADFWVTTVLRNLPNTGIPAPPPYVVVVRPEQGVSEIRGRAGQTLTGAIEVRVVVQAGIQTGQPLPNVGLSVSTGNDPLTGVFAACVGGTVLTDESGTARCDLRLGGVIGTANLLVDVGNLPHRLDNLTVTVDPGLPARINKLQGDGQVGKPGERLPLALLAEVTDSFGNRLSAVPVQWAVSPSGAATLSSVIATSDFRGRTSAVVTLGQTPGQVQVTVTAGAASATFTATIEVTAAQLRKVSGDNQSAVINQQFAAPLVVQLLDAQNQPVPNAVVSFAVTSGSATLSSPTATSDPQGNAQMTVRAGSSAGPIEVTASFANLPAVTFNLTARLPGPSLTQGSFVNAASGAPGLVPGSIVKIVAPGMAPGVRNNCVIPDARVGALPLALAEVSVEFQAGSVSAFGPLYYVCNLNGEEAAAVQVPFGLPLGTATVTVRAGGGSASISGVPVRPYQPGIFETIGSNGLRHGVLMRPDGTFVSQENPARRGEIVYLFATGLGAVTPAAATNAAGQGQSVNAQVIVGINNAGVRVLRAEYAVNMIGIYVVAFEVPADTAPGANRPLALAVLEGDQLMFGNGSSIPIQ